jgi:hypothetical protein
MEASAEARERARAGRRAKVVERVEDSCHAWRESMFEEEKSQGKEGIEMGGCAFGLGLDAARVSCLVDMGGPCEGDDDDDREEEEEEEEDSVRGPGEADDRGGTRHEFAHRHVGEGQERQSHVRDYGNDGDDNDGINDGASCFSHASAVPARLAFSRLGTGAEDYRGQKGSGSRLARVDSVDEGEEDEGEEEEDDDDEWAKGWRDENHGVVAANEGTAAATTTTTTPPGHPATPGTGRGTDNAAAWDSGEKLASVRSPSPVSSPPPPPPPLMAPSRRSACAARRRVPPSAVESQRRRHPRAGMERPARKPQPPQDTGETLGSQRGECREGEWQDGGRHRQAPAPPQMGFPEATPPTPPPLVSKPTHPTIPEDARVPPPPRPPRASSRARREGVAAGPRLRPGYVPPVVARPPAPLGMREFWKDAMPPYAYVASPSVYSITDAASAAGVSSEVYAPTDLGP